MRKDNISYFFSWESARSGCARPQQVTAAGHTVWPIHDTTGLYSTPLGRTPYLCRSYPHFVISLDSRNLENQGHRHGLATPGLACQRLVLLGQAWPLGSCPPGQVRPGVAMPGQAWPGLAAQGLQMLSNVSLKPSQLIHPFQEFLCSGPLLIPWLWSLTLRKIAWSTLVGMMHSFLHMEDVAPCSPYLFGGLRGGMNDD